ncbi:MAG: hypothetical protein CR974_04320 [Gammaproteobacteria bacterium]|nr:MAG: hypothetical protein CR974_04320 [Gammaproteobacteria bacterium]
MIAAIIILAIVVGLVYLATLLSKYPGYVEIGLQSGSFQMPIWYFLLALLVVIGVSLVAVKIIWTIVRLPSISKRFGKNRRVAKANHLLQKGMLAMGKGQWRRAEKLLAKGARLSHKGQQDAGLFLSIAAQAAQNQGDSKRRDHYLLEARQLAAEGADTFTAALAEAELHLEASEPKQALAILKEHQTLHYANERLLNLESRAYQQLGEHSEVWRLLKNLKKSFPDRASYQARQVEVAKDLFAALNSPIDSIETVWAELPKSEKQDDTVILAYVSALINQNEKEKAEAVLAKEIRATYADPLIHAYTQLEVGSSRERLDKLTGWLRSRPDNAYLNYGAAKLAFQSEDLEKAKTFAERSVKAQPLPEALALLGKIYEALGQENNALQAYRTSLGLTYKENQAVSGDVLSAPETMALSAASGNDEAADAAKSAGKDDKKADA